MSQQFDNGLQMNLMQCGAVITQSNIIPMGWCKKDVTPLLTHWSYVFLALAHRYTELRWQKQNISQTLDSKKPAILYLHMWALGCLVHILEKSDCYNSTALYTVSHHDGSTSNCMTLDISHIFTIKWCGLLWFRVRVYSGRSCGSQSLVNSFVILKSPLNMR